MSTPTPRMLKGFRLVAVIAGGGCAALIVLLIIIGIIVSAANGTLGRGVPEETAPTSTMTAEATPEASEPSRETPSTSEPAKEPSEVESATEAPESSTPQAATTEADPVAIPGCEVTPAETTLGEDIMATELPDGLVITAVTENRPDSDIDPSLTWVRVEVCSSGLSTEEHRVVATDIAIAARDAADGGDRIWRLSVTSWKAIDGAEYPELERALYVEDFSMYTWDRDAAVPPEGTWEDNTA